MFEFAEVLNLFATTQIAGPSPATGGTGAVFTNAYALQTANLVAADIATGTIHLLKYGALTPNPNTPLADFTAAQPTYSGYDNTGIVIENWGLAINNPGGGASTPSGVVTFSAIVDEPFVSDTIGGWYYVRGTLVVCYDLLTDPWPITKPSDGFPMNITAIFRQLLEE